MEQNIFKWFNFIINAFRLFTKIFGNDEEAAEARKSEEKTGDGDNMNAC